MPNHTTTRLPVRKPVEEIRVPVHKLFEQVLDVSKQFSNEGDKQIAFAEGQAILDRKDGDCQKNRFAMRRLLRDAEKWVRSEVGWKVADEAREAAKAAALAEYEDLVAPVRTEWTRANEAWVKFVQAENALGHDGQRAISHELWQAFAGVAPLVVMPKSNPEAISALVTELEGLTFRAGNFVQARWCKRCGAPVYEIKPKGEGKRPFTPDLCGTCFHEDPADHTSIGRKSFNSQFVLELTPEDILEKKAAEHRANEERRLANIRKNDLAKATRKSKKVTPDGQGGKKSKKTSNKNAPVADLANGEKEPTKAKVATKKKNASKGE